MQEHKIKVQFIDASNGNTIGVTEMTPEQLPETFEIDTTLHLNNEDWSIQEAIPAHSKDFITSKALTLKMKKVETINPKDILYSLPTISNEIPEMATSNEFSTFEYSIVEDDWRQSEFLKQSSLSLIEVEFNKIEDIKQNSSKEVDADFTAFTNCHLRDTIGAPNLEMDFLQLKAILKTESVGSLKIANQFIKNGFSIKTEATTFYGTLENGLITQFCVGAFSEHTRLDIQNVSDEFNLFYVGWCHCQIMKPND